MALAGRSSRSGGGRRLLIVALLLTIVVVVIDASLKSRSPAPTQTLDGQVWIDRALPWIADSTSDGMQLARFRTHGLGMQAPAITAELDQAAASAQRDYRSVVALRAPASLGGAPGLLQACLLVRAEATRALASAVAAALSRAAPGGASDPEVVALARSGQDLQVADRAYQLFASSLPGSLGVPAPPSRWIGDASQYDPGALQVFLVALRNSTSLTPVHLLAIQAVSTSPPPVGVQGAIQEIPPTRAIAVSIVVADTGNQNEPDLTVTATVAPVAAGEPSSVRAFVSLTPGTSHASTIGPVVPLSGAPATLTVTVTPPAGSPTAAVSTTLQIEVAAPPVSTTTSTTTPATATTAAGGGPQASTTTTATTG